MHLPTSWERRLFSLLGAPTTPANLGFIRAWQRAEGGTAAFNPLNTTLDLHGARDYNTAHVKNYRDAVQGIAATGLTLTNGFYPGLVASFVRGTETTAQRVARHRGEITIWGTNPDAIR